LFVFSHFSLRAENNLDTAVAFCKSHTQQLNQDRQYQIPLGNILLLTDLVYPPSSFLAVGLVFPAAAFPDFLYFPRQREAEKETSGSRVTIFNLCALYTR